MKVRDVSNIDHFDELIDPDKNYSICFGDAEEQDLDLEVVRILKDEDGSKVIYVNYNGPRIDC